MMSTRNQKIMKTIVGIFLFVLVVGYGLFQARFLIQGPVVSIVSPHNGATLRSAVVHIEGETENTTSLELNDRKIYTNEEGRFEERVILSQGHNTVTVEASDRFGRTTKNVIELIHKPLTSTEEQLSQQGEKQQTENESS